MLWVESPPPLGVEAGQGGDVSRGEERGSSGESAVGFSAAGPRRGLSAVPTCHSNKFRGSADRVAQRGTDKGRAVDQRPASGAWARGHLASRAGAYPSERHSEAGGK